MLGDVEQLTSSQIPLSGQIVSDTAPEYTEISPGYGVQGCDIDEPSSANGGLADSEALPKKQMFMEGHTA